MTVLPSCPTSIMWVVWLQLNSNMQKHFLKRLTQHNQRAWVFLLRCLRDCLAHQCIHLQAPLYHSQDPHDMVRHKKSWSSVFQRVRLIISKQFFCIDIYPRIECTFCKDYFCSQVHYDLSTSYRMQILKISFKAMPVMLSGQLIYKYN